MMPWMIIYRCSIASIGNRVEIDLRCWLWWPTNLLGLDHMSLQVKQNSRWPRIIILSNIATIIILNMGKRPQGKLLCVVFHSIANVFLQIMTLSISNISLQKCYSKVLLWIAIFHWKHESFPLWMFSRTWYWWFLY